MLKEFASFHNHSHFSVFDGLSLPEELLKAAKEKGLKSIALTDHGVTHGHADWYLMGKKMGVRTVFGVEAYVIHNLKEWSEQKAKAELQKKSKKNHAEFADDGDVVDAKELRRKGHLVILACNREGLSNLYQLTFKAHKFGFYGKPRMDKVMLKEHARGLVATSACMGGVIAKRLWDMKDGEATWDDVKREVLEYDEVFGRGRFFLELQFNEMDKEQNFINTSLVRLSKETGVPLTVTTDSHYATESEWEPRELLHMLGWSKKTVNDFPEKKIDTQIKQLFVKSPEEMWLTYEKYAGHCIDQKTAMEAFQGTILIDSLIEDFEPDTHQRLPTLPYENPFKDMGRRAAQGLKALGLLDKDEYVDRLRFELGVIQQKGIANYFLVCQQIINEAKKYMLVGPGRGSAAGSLVCYCLGITDLDPLKHDLLFERFLDVDRAELPDIDTDFEYPKRAKKMLQKMFGEDNVASLSSYGTFQIKGLLKDLGRVYGLDHNDINKVTHAIDKELKVLYKDQDKSTLVIKIEDLKVSPTFNKFVEANPELGGQIKKLYGRIRHVTCHAAGVIIGDNLPAETSCFIAKGKKIENDPDAEEGEDESGYTVQTSFTEGIVNKNLSAMGFVKMDLLGLANLRVIHHALDLISKKTGKTFAELYESIRPHKMDLDDMEVMKNIFWNGNFGAIFQFTNPGIRALAQRVKPDSFIDISAVVSLYRPGPLKGGYHKVYVNAKHGGVKSLGHPLLDEILGKTKGCLVFQEQLMEVCRRFGKMTGKEVNRVRKVLLKKDKSKTEEFLKQENDTLFASFCKGCAEHGFPGAKEMLGKSVPEGVKLPKRFSVLEERVAEKGQRCEICLARIKPGDAVARVKEFPHWIHLICAEGPDEKSSSENKTLKLWEDIKAFGGYAFNKSHSDAYSVVTMQTAYLATYYPLEFYAAALTKAQANAIQTLVSDIQKTGTKLLPVDVNTSRGDNVIENGCIRLSLSRVKGVGPAVIEKIVAHQPYTTFLDFLDRSGAGKTAIAPLIRVGAFDSLMALSDVCSGPNMKALEEFYRLYCEDTKLKQKKNKERLDGLFWEKTSGSTLNDPLPDDYRPEEKLGMENELMDFIMAGSPFEVLDRKKKIDVLFDLVNEEMEKTKDSKKPKLQLIRSYQEFIDSELETGMLPVVVKDYKEKPQRNGQMFAFVKFATEDGIEFDAPAFSTIWKWIGPVIRKGSAYVVTFSRSIEEDPENLKVGKPGWAQSEKTSTEAFIDVDQITL